jgi:predicted alpha/beta-hydrolase family hydrolase
MPSEPEQLKIQVNERESVTALLYPAAKANRKGVTLILGHGAGGNQLSGFMRLFAAGLSARDLDTVTFNFLYSELAKSGPDPKARLESCYRAVIETVLIHKKLKGNRLVVGGKSMGGRIASQVAAELNGFTELKGDGETTNALKGKNKPHLTKSLKADGIAGLIFLGYPLHPPGRPEQLRDKHLKDIRAPMLFVQGTRDAFGTPEELREVIKRLHLPATLHFIEGGDHSFKVPKSGGLSQEGVHEAIMDEVASWITAKL